MPEDDREFQKRWKELAERISKQCDRSKITKLTQELIKALDEEIKKSEPQARTLTRSQHKVKRLSCVLGKPTNDRPLL